MPEPYGKHSNATSQVRGPDRIWPLTTPQGAETDTESAGKRLLVRSVPIPDPGEEFTEAIPEPAALAWIRQGAGLAGWGEAARVTLPAGPDRFAVGERWLREVVDAADIDDQAGRRGSGLVAFGSFTFDDTAEGSVLIVPRALIGRDGTGNAWLTTITPGGESPRPTTPPGTPPPGPGPALDWLTELLPDWPGSRVPVTAPGPLRWHDGSLSGPEWQQTVAEAVRRIRHSGELRKVVLARDIYAEADDPIDARVLVRRLAGRYPGCWSFACDGLVGATPELLIRRDGWEVSSLVLAGTAPRGTRPEEDASLAGVLLGSAKENEEHQYAVASLQDALAPLCAAMYVAPRPELIRLPDVQHLGTRVRGTLAAPRSSLALAAAVHPTAAVGGTPTDAAVRLIRELESMDRGRYAGPVGWMDSAGNGEWAIALRCAELDGNRARLFAGCGIVAGSDPAAELAETESKFRPMRTALEQAG